jgi:hypothetical protein
MTDLASQAETPVRDKKILKKINGIEKKQRKKIQSELIRLGIEGAFDDVKDSSESEIDMIFLKDCAVLFEKPV